MNDWKQTQFGKEYDAFRQELDGYYAAIQDQLPRVILRQKLRDALGEAYCQAHGLTFTKVNPPEKMRDYVQSYLDGLLDKYSAKITYFPALNG